LLSVAIETPVLGQLWWYCTVFISLVKNSSDHYEQLYISFTCFLMKP